MDSNLAQITGENQANAAHVDPLTVLKSTSLEMLKSNWSHAPCNYAKHSSICHFAWQAEGSCGQLYIYIYTPACCRFAAGAQPAAQWHHALRWTCWCRCLSIFLGHALPLLPLRSTVETCCQHTRPTRAAPTGAGAS